MSALNLARQALKRRDSEVAISLRRRSNNSDLPFVKHQFSPNKNYGVGTVYVNNGAPL